MCSSVLFWRSGAPGVADPLDAAFFRDWAGFVPDPGEKGVWISGQTGGKESPLIRVCGDCTTAFDVAGWLEGQGLLRDWDSVLASSQRAGVGQYGRTWISPPGNLHVVWKLPAAFLRRGALLSLILGAALAEALAEVGVETALKWPNDLVMEEKKMGGMLIRSSPGCVFAGIGMNLVSFPSALEIRKESLLQATSLKNEGYFFTPLAFWGEILGHAQGHLLKMIEKIPDYVLIPDLTRRLWRKGCPVMVYPSERPAFRAVLVGLAGDGGLRLLSGGREEVLYSGSIGPA